MQPDFGQLDHLGDRLALEPHRQRAERIHVRLMQLLRAELEHFDEARFIEHGIGIGRTHEARHAARSRRRHFGLERRLVFETRLAQPRA